MNAPPMRPSERKRLEEAVEECSKCKATVCPLLLAEAPSIICQLWRTKEDGACPYQPQIHYGRGVLKVGPEIVRPDPPAYKPVRRRR